MRLVKNLRVFEDDISASSSVQSVDSYGIFGSAYSDLSDGEVRRDDRKRSRRQRNSKCYYTPDSANSYRSAMNRSENSPLLVHASPLVVPSPRAPLYKSCSEDSMNPDGFLSNEFFDSYKKPSTPEKFEKKKQNSIVTIFSIWNTIMGSSLLTMAWGVERAGLPAAIVLVSIMSALCLYTAYLLLKVNYHHGNNSCEVPALCRILLGPFAERVAHLFSLIVLVGANIIYWILITNFLYFTVNYLTDLASPNRTEYTTTVLCPNAVNESLMLPTATADTPSWGLHSTVPIYVAIIVFPLLLFRNVSFFTRFNSLGTLSAVYLVLFVIIKGFMWGINVSSMPLRPNAAKDMAVLSGMLAMSFYIHNIIITIMSNNARQEKNGRDLTIAFLLVTITYTLLGVVFYICFPLAKSCIEDNILNNFEMHDVMTALARMLLLFQVITVYPLTAFLLRSETILLLPIPDHIKNSWWFTIFCNVCIVTMCILMACFCSNIGTIIRFTGAVSGMVHVFTLPSLLTIRSLQLRYELTWWKATIYCLIILFGAVNLLLQFFINE